MAAQSFLNFKCQIPVPSVEPDMRNQHLDEILRHYHGVLTKHLLVLKHNSLAYPFDKLEDDFEDGYLFGFVFEVAASQVSGTFIIYFHETFYVKK